ncbi:hypothetical protein DEH69_29960 [Streptomyces sp. PT12]|nr:hypothetical protein DEH69_29960 [Streptomyces sp. PT12]
MGAPTSWRDEARPPASRDSATGVEDRVSRAELRKQAQALDQLAVTWYAMGMDRVREVRRALQPWRNDRCVRDLDDRLYSWATTVSALAR